MSTTAYIGLGSNLGDRQDYLDRALQALQGQPGIAVCLVSSYYDTAPVGGPPGQRNYLNAAAELQTDLSPEDLLRLLLEVEHGLGRVRGERNAPRTIDLDLLLYDDLVCQHAELTLPHPRMHDRLFVLEPFAEIAPKVLHPVLGLTIQELLEKLCLPPASPLPPTQPEARRPWVEEASLQLTGLRAVVTGSSSGIGLAMAMALAEAGADVIIHRRNPGSLPPEMADLVRAEAEKKAAAVRSFGVRSQTILADLRESDQCRELVEAAWRQWDGLDIWINNAGADTLTGAAADWSFERKFEELLAVDVRATMLLARDVGQRMKARGKGVLLNMGWDQAEIGMEGDSGQLFATTKAAVMAFSKSLALTLAPEVRVNCLAPGWIRTAWGEKASGRWQERVQRETPLGRWGTPSDVAAVARWLVSPAAAFITGQVIRINGGAVR